jgi:hypothetical protein
MRAHRPSARPVLGPDVTWTRGRFWVAGVFAIGVHEITAAPRLNLGMRW